ncbi:hypothetical protein HPP92_012801 [Vanilla planifolia]|uniref:Uncharacterized protein n=1 Tax=Vanilla planifolia TaxID=51239 RepID=A0A835R0Q0_VANPL|nr:hypothetical protein HPP92_013226 [Vanilla planifolia]KAG0478082.1 hypothetical protein HPP92_012801 [Vanilla planifolia]
MQGPDGAGGCNGHETWGVSLWSIHGASRGEQIFNELEGRAVKGLHERHCYRYLILRDLGTHGQGHLARASKGSLAKILELGAAVDGNAMVEALVRPREELSFI